jgi:hypothetical protein
LQAVFCAALAHASSKISGTKPDCRVPTRFSHLVWKSGPNGAQWTLTVRGSAKVTFMLARSFLLPC